MALQFHCRCCLCSNMPRPSVHATVCFCCHSFALKPLATAAASNLVFPKKPPHASYTPGALCMLLPSHRSLVIHRFHQSTKQMTAGHLDSIPQQMSHICLCMALPFSDSSPVIQSFHQSIKQLSIYIHCRASTFTAVKWPQSNGPSQWPQSNCLAGLNFCKNA